MEINNFPGVALIANQASGGRRPGAQRTPGKPSAGTRSARGQGPPHNAAALQPQCWVRDMAWVTEVAFSHPHTPRPQARQLVPVATWPGSPRPCHSPRKAPQRRGLGEEPERGGGRRATACPLLEPLLSETSGLRPAGPPGSEVHGVGGLAPRTCPARRCHPRSPVSWSSGLSQAFPPCRWQEMGVGWRPRALACVPLGVTAGLWQASPHSAAWPAPGLQSL